MARPFQTFTSSFSPPVCIFSSSLAPFAVSFHFLSGLLTPSLESTRFFILTTPPPPFPCPHAPLLYGFLLFTCMPLSFSLCLSLSHPPSLFFFWVISLSYVCPSLYVCVPPLFVSDSFSREIRDAYLVPLFSTSAAAPSYTVRRWPRRQKPHTLIPRSSYPDQCQRPGEG